MINWQDKAYRTLQEHVLRNTQDIRELFKKLRHTRWTSENVAKLYDSLTALKYDDPEIALDLIDELITALGGNPPARPKHALIGIKAETSHGAVSQFDLIDKDWFEVTAYFEDGTSEPVTDFLLLTEVAMTAPYTNVEVEYLGFRDVVPLEANARRVITLNTANTTTVVNDQTGRVLHNGDSVFDGDVLTMASSQPNGGYLITGRNVEQLGIVNPIEVGGTITVHADVIVNVFAKAEVYHTVTINKASGVTFTLVDEAGNNVASGASFLEGTKLTVTAIGDVYPHAAVVGGELIQLYEGTVIVVSDDVVITVGEAQPEPPETQITIHAGNGVLGIEGDVTFNVIGATSGNSYGTITVTPDSVEHDFTFDPVGGESLNIVAADTVVCNYATNVYSVRDDRGNQGQVFCSIGEKPWITGQAYTKVDWVTGYAAADHIPSTLNAGTIVGTVAAGEETNFWIWNNKMWKSDTNTGLVINVPGIAANEYTTSMIFAWIREHVSETSILSCMF